MRLPEREKPMAGITLKYALESCGYTPKMLYERVKGCGISPSVFRHKVLNVCRPGTGRVWDLVMKELDKMGVDW